MIYDKSKYIRCEWCDVLTPPQITYPIQYQNIILVERACLCCLLKHKHWIKQQENKKKNK